MTAPGERRGFAVTINPTALRRENRQLWNELVLLVEAIGRVRSDRLPMDAQVAFGRARRFIKRPAPAAAVETDDAAQTFAEEPT